MSSPPPPAPPVPPPPLAGNHHITAKHLILPLVATIVTLLLFLLLLLFLHRRFRHLLHRPRTTATTPCRFSYSSLRRATAGFSPSRRLGQGGFGAVFAGTLTLSLNSQSQSKIPIAVKVMDSGSLQGEREFHNEIVLAEKFVDSDRVVKLLGFSSSRKRRRMCLVYELMSKGNLQDCLLHKKAEELMEWSNRFRIAVEVAQALAYLHHQCDPPVIHGDVKPSNILLDDNYSAKIGDFGLARLKLIDTDTPDVVINIGEVKSNHDIDNNNNNNNKGGNVGVGVEDIGSVLETESVTTTVGFDEGSLGVDQSPVTMALAVETSPEMVTAEASPSEFFDKGSDFEGQVDSWKMVGDVENVNGNEKRKVGLGEVGDHKDENDEASKPVTVKDYVMEWIGTEVDTERPLSSYLGGGASSRDLANENVKNKKKGKKKLEWWVSIDGGKTSKKERRKPAREWWKEEYSEELANKKKKKKKKNEGVVSDKDESLWPQDDGLYVDIKNKKKKKKNEKNNGNRSSRSNIDWWLDGLSGNLGKAHYSSHDSMSGDVSKCGGISSTPSMRGTVCYIAPEYSSGGDLSEKCDVYSFGVLLLVLIAGRRPLQVTGSPMSEFHRANLISWARQLARAGKLLDLLDTRIRSLNAEQAQLCITVALVCLQKSPARRPTMKEVLGILTGEVGAPTLPMDYSPYPFKSRKKHR